MVNAFEIVAIPIKSFTGAITFEIVTTLTIASIGTIIALYFIVLKRKGWLTEEHPSETSYLCPNLQCRKVFQNPIRLTDLSVTPPREYFGCPHCGLDLGRLKLEPQKSTANDKILRARLTSEDLSEHPQSPTPKVISETRTQRTPISKNEPVVRRVDAETELSKSFVARENTQQKLEESPKKSGEKGSFESHRKCSHFFGYVRSLPKNTPIPDECLWCPSIVDCLSREQKVEAEA